MRPFILFCIVGLLGGAVMAQTETSADYWPLHVGNRWVYEHTSGFYDSDGLRIDSQEQVVLEVLGEEEVEGNTYFRLNTGQLIRKNEKGDILEYNDRFDEIQDTEMLVYDFSSPANRANGIFAHRPPYAFRPPTIGGGSLTQDPSFTRYDVYRNFHRGKVYVDDYDFYIPRGEFENVLLCAFSYSFNTTAGWFILFAPDIGIVSSVNLAADNGQFEHRYLLVEAVIAGEQEFPTNISTSSWGEIKEITIRKTGSKKGG